MNRKDTDNIYEDNPWKDSAPGKLVPADNLLPTAESFSKSKTYIVSEEKLFSAEDLKIIEQLAAERNLTPTAMMAGVLHDFVTGQLVKRDE